MRNILIFIYLFAFNLGLYSQNIKLNYNNVALNDILIELRKEQNIQISFDNDLLSKFNITINQEFLNIEEAIKALIFELPLDYEKSGNVYLIYPKKESKVHEPPPPPKKYFLNGFISDNTNNEPLPFAQVVVDNHGVISDVNGIFSYNSLGDSIFEVKISYLGYYLIDTTLYATHMHNLKLIPSTVGLKEIIVKGKEIDFGSQTGTQPGKLKLNHKVAVFLPG